MQILSAKEQIKSTEYEIEDQYGEVEKTDRGTRHFYVNSPPPSHFHVETFVLSSQGCEIHEITNTRL